MKSFLITVDTEGDNQWKMWNGEETTTENAKYIPRFQSLCEEYGFKPVYLMTWEMADDAMLVAYLKNKAQFGLCEIGMHLHAWSSPPAYDLPRKYNGNPYITEYSQEIMYEKMRLLTEHLENRFEVKPISHRAGRWASNPAMFDVLTELGYKVDCSVVSGWNASRITGQSTNVGFDYSKAPKKVFWVKDGLLEVPMIVERFRSISGKTLREKISRSVKGRDTWLRPAMSDSVEMMRMLSKNENDYAMFMIHSTELMPGGSPYFKTAEDVEREYGIIKNVFDDAQSKYTGASLEEYFNAYSCDIQQQV